MMIFTGRSVDALDEVHGSNVQTDNRRDVSAIAIAAGWFSSLRRPGKRNKKGYQKQAKSAWDLSTLSTCCERQSTAEGNHDESTYGALSCPVAPRSGPGPPPTYDSLIFDPKSLPASIEKKMDGPETPGTIIPSMVSSLLGLASSPVECNESSEQETAATDEGLPSYEAALKLDSNGYV